MLIKPIYIFPLLIALAACNQDAELVTSTLMPLVVEGWIEDGSKPIVIVTRAADLSQDIDNVDDLVQRWCRITVSDGEKSEILTMRIDNDYTPSVIYTSATMVGKEGCTYSLKVETEYDTVYSTTTIPPVVPIDSVKTDNSVTGDNSKYVIHIYPDIDSEKSKYYKIFTCVTNEETRFYSSFLGTFMYTDYSPTDGWNAARGIHDTSADETFSPYYQSGDNVRVKLCTMEEEIYNFWIAYENAVSLQRNPFFSVTDGCPSNIVGGLGYWAGYGTSYARVIVE